MTANAHWSQSTEYRRAAQRALAYSEQGELKLWVSCFACAQIVGQYERGATIVLAHELHRSVDTVEARARAAHTYRVLFSYFRDSPEIQKRLRAIRRVIGYSFFSEAGKMLRNDTPPLEVFAQLDTAAREGAGSKSMGSNGRVSTIELPVLSLTSTTIHDLIDRQGRKAKIVVLPDDYEGESVKVYL